MNTTWDEWARIKRFLESSRVSYARERLLIQSLQLSDFSEAKIAVPAGLGRYKLSLKDHLNVIEDETPLYNAVLVQTYALVEATAADLLGTTGVGGGIETWGTAVLSANSRAWTDVVGGRSGLVEVAIVRNVVAHGTGIVDASSAQRAAQAGLTSYPTGTVIALDYDKLETYRGRLKSLLRFSGVR